MVEKIYVVENCDCGVEKAFYSEESARQYVLKGCLDFVKHNKDNFNVEDLVDSIEQLFNENCIENWYYIYSLEIEG